MLVSQQTKAVDIFSMGCVFYFVICGEHPFGGSFNRQARIVAGDYDITLVGKEKRKSLNCLLRIDHFCLF